MRKIAIFSAYMLLIAAACTTTDNNEKSHIFIISTNDIHANINSLPQLATLVDEYEERGEVILVDSGDRVTGNAFIDDCPEPGVAMIELMNEVGYDVVTLGNHEFDKGPEILQAMLDKADFEIVCANITTPTNYYDIEPYTYIDVNGIVIGIAGIVDTDNNGRPLGGQSALADFGFTSDIDCAYDTSTILARQCDFAILLSHMGLKQDINLSGRDAHYDWIAGGHSHDVVGHRYGDIYISQNGKNLRYVTIADIEVTDDEISSVSYHREAIDNEAADETIAAMVAEIKSRNPELNTIEGHANALATQDGVANFTIAALAAYPYADGFTPDVSLYHFGGIRLTNILPGDITRGDIYNNDPFLSTIYIGELTTEQMSDFILRKYNSGTPDFPDKESHYPYIRTSVPYTILLGSEPQETPDATGIYFDLEEGIYRVAMCNYIAENYIDADIVERQLRPTGITVREAMLHYLHSLDEGLTPDNNVYQIEVSPNELE